jgi:signal transduction histidine kinase
MNSPETKINILLVDDREENLISLAAVLDRPDYNLVKATSGRLALRALMERDYALILMDVQMPVMDGFETASLIKERERTKDIPIIFITAISKDEPYIFKGYNAGAVDYIFKPFEPAILRGKVAVFAELYRKTVETQRQAELLRQAERAEEERKRAELELMSLRREQAAHERYRQLVEGIHHGVVWVLDSKTFKLRFLSPQAESILGYPADIWRDQENFWLSHVHRDDSAAVLERLREAAFEGKSVMFEHRFVRGDGTFAWLHTSVRRGDNELRGLSVDVTHLKNAEETAHKAIQLRDEFLSIASHELKTPLTPLKLQIQLLRRLQEMNVEPEVLKKRLAIVVESTERQIHRLGKLVDELLDVSRIHYGKMSLERSEVDLAELIRELVSRFSGELKLAGCTVELEAPEQLIANVDRMRIEQVFTNLLTNAAKYGSGKPIAIRLQGEGNQAVLEIQDHGIGISIDDQARIFKRFERAVSPANFGGLGLGLYIVSQILDAHGGEISVRSSPGQGSCFSVRLPRSSKAAIGLVRGEDSAKTVLSGT